MVKLVPHGMHVKEAVLKNSSVSHLSGLGMSSIITLVVSKTGTRNRKPQIGFKLRKPGDMTAWTTMTTRQMKTLHLKRTRTSWETKSQIKVNFEECSSGKMKLASFNFHDLERYLKFQNHQEEKLDRILSNLYRCFSASFTTKILEVIVLNCEQNFTYISHLMCDLNFQEGNNI